MAAPGPLTRARLIPPNPSSTPYAFWTTGVPGTRVWPVVFQAHEEPAARARFGIPSEDILVSFAMQDPLGWDGYVFCLLGAVSTTPPAATAPLFYLEVQTHPQTPATTLQLVAWSRTVYCPDTPVRVESRWHPTEGGTLTLEGPDKDTTRSDLLKAFKGRRLLKAIAAVGGRPPAMEKGSFEQNYRDTYARLLDKALRDGNRLPTKIDVATEMPMSSKSLTRYLRRYHLPWPPFP